jgi:hypothetical protein
LRNVWSVRSPRQFDPVGWQCQAAHRAERNRRNADPQQVDVLPREQVAQQVDREEPGDHNRERGAESVLSQEEIAALPRRQQGCHRHRPAHLQASSRDPE